MFPQDTVPWSQLLLCVERKFCCMSQADFSFFFDTGGRRRCYIAPERFFISDVPEAAALADAPLQPSMASFLLPKTK